MSFLANILGYLLNALYNVFNNYGIAIILFSVIIRIVLIPITIKQQKSMEKNNDFQKQMNELQEKYKNNPDKLNQEIMSLYKETGVNPFSGCFSSIIQFVIILSVFYLVKSPLTFMKKVDPQIIEQYKNEIAEENGTKNAYYEIEIINRKSDIDENVRINMNFLGLDLSKVPTNNLTDWKIYILPVLYVISSFVSIKLTTKMQKKDVNKNNNDIIVENNEEKALLDKDSKKGNAQEEMMNDMNKSMSIMLPIMSISVALIAPLGLALYWLISNILMILERLIIFKFLKPKEEK